MAYPATQTAPGATTRATAISSELRDFFDRYSRAVTAADLPALVGAWETPAFVLSDIGAHAVSSPDEITRFFAGAKEQYHARGIVDTRADILFRDWPTDRIAIVSVRWPLIDRHGMELGFERSTYTLCRDDTGRLRIRAAVMHGATIENPS